MQGKVFLRNSDNIGRDCLSDGFDWSDISSGNNFSESLPDMYF